MTLTLHSSLTSPYGRKVRIAAAVLGVELDIVHADTRDPDDRLRRLNPLGKIPVLVLAGGVALYDSRVIVEHLDACAGHVLFPTEPLARARAQTLATLFDGIADAALLMVYERRWRDGDARSEEWIAHQRGKIDRALTAADGLASGLERLDGPAISLVAALGYLDWRRPVPWREEYGALANWLRAMAAEHPVIAQTDPIREAAA